ncbi:extracellular solute-binding protein, partial [Rhizobium johnstonii]
MKTYLSGAFALALATVSFAWAGAAMAETKTITFLFTDDDQAYVERMEALSKEFEAAHPDVKVNFVSSGYDAVAKQLPVQLAVGEGPDIAKITDWQLAPYYLDISLPLKAGDNQILVH